MDLKDVSQGRWPEFTDWHAPDLFEFFLWILRKNEVFKYMFKYFKEDIFNIIFEISLINDVIIDIHFIFQSKLIFDILQSLINNDNYLW